MTRADDPSELRLESHFVEVLGSKLHTFDEGEGRPVVFFHDNPVWSYMWRNVLPEVSPVARCLAVDCIGMGRSDKPDLEYDFFDHTRYLDGFIEALDLRDLVLVGHAWGITLAAYYAQRHPERVAGMAFVVQGGWLLEAVLESVPSWDDLIPGAREMFRAYRDPASGWKLIAEENHFLEVTLPAAVMRELSPRERAYYAEPYRTPRERKPLFAWPQQVPIAGEPPEVARVVDSLRRWLPTWEAPKLVAHATPNPEAVAALGIPPERQTLPWLREHLANARFADVGPGGHYLPEDQPRAIGSALRDWLVTLA